MPWCVRSRYSWCLVKGGKKPDEAAHSVETKCGYHIVLPFGVEKRQPTCELCSRPISPQMLKILQYLCVRGVWTSPTEIGTELHNQHSAWASPKLQRLLRHGYVEREHPRGWWRITPRGKSRLILENDDARPRL